MDAAAEQLARGLEVGVREHLVQLGEAARIGRAPEQAGPQLGEQRVHAVHPVAALLDAVARHAVERHRQLEGLAAGADARGPAGTELAVAIEAHHQRLEPGDAALLGVHAQAQRGADRAVRGPARAGEDAQQRERRARGRRRQAAGRAHRAPAAKSKRCRHHTATGAPRCWAG